MCLIFVTYNAIREQIVQIDKEELTEQTGRTASMRARNAKARKRVTETMT